MTTGAAEAPMFLPLRATWWMLRPIHRHLVATAVMSGLAELAGLAPYVAAAEIARAVITTSEPGGVWAWVVVGCAGVIVRLILLALSSHVGHRADAVMPRHLVARMVDRLGALPLGWFRSTGSGRIKKAMNDDLGAMHELFAHALGGLVGALAGTLAAATYLLLVDWRMALITIAAPVVGAVGLWRSMRSAPALTERFVAAEDGVSAASVEYVDGVGAVKTFGGTDRRVLARFDAAMGEYAAAYRAFLAEHRTGSVVCGLLGGELTVLAVVVAAGVGFVSAGSIDVADLVPFVVVGVGLPTMFGPVLRGASGLRSARLAAGSIDRILSLPPIPQPDRPREPRGHRIEFDDVTFSYDGVTNAVEHISAVCRPGTLTALVGPSGAGKSTLASLVPRFHDVATGMIRIGGVDVREIATDRLLASMSLVFQDVTLVRDTVRENIRLARPDATDDEVRRAAKAAHIHDVIEALPQGYETMLGADRAGLSGGEQQRLTIARAILSEAPIVVLDEATAALDPDSEAAVQDALSELVTGKTVLVVAHRLRTIAGADQILVLDGGRIVERGSHAELLTRDGRYARMWHAQQMAAHQMQARGIEQ